MKKTIICKGCDASFVPETDLQKITFTCNNCLEKTTNCLPDKSFVEKTGEKVK